MFPSGARHLPRAPLPATSITLSGAGSTPPRQALPCPLRSYWLMRPTEILCRLSSRLYGESLQVPASRLLEDGGSRRYLHSPCIGAWSLTPS